MVVRTVKTFKTRPNQAPPASCRAGHENNAGLCYPLCNQGYVGVGPVCWETCPEGWIDEGALCQPKVKFKQVSEKLILYTDRLRG